MPDQLIVSIAAWTSDMTYYPKIDGLRFLAIFFVLIEHFAPTIGHKISAGYYGVDLFFVISGFLVTNILIHSKRPFFQAYKNFVGRRVLRIFPIYYLTLGILFAVGYEPCRTSILYLATYTYNYAWIRLELPMGAITHFWSLAVEEQFYLIWPVAALSLRRFPKILFWMTATIVALCFYQLVTQRFDAITPYNYVGLFPRAASLGLGALGAMIFRNKAFLESLFRNILLEWIVLAGLIVTLVTEYDLKYPALGLCSLYLVLKSAHSDFSFDFLNRFLTHPAVLKIGAISYGIYIFHVPIGHFLTTYIFSPWWYSIDFDSLGHFSFLREMIWVILLPLYSLLAIGIASLSSRYIEKPILSLKDKFFP